MGGAESFEDFRSLSKLTLGLICAFFIVQMLIFYWKVGLKAEGEFLQKWEGPLKALAKAAHYEITPSLMIFCISIFVVSFELAGILLFLISIIGDTFIVIGYHRAKEGWSMLMLGRFLTHLSTLGVLILALINTFYFGLPVTS